MPPPGGRTPEFMGSLPPSLNRKLGVMVRSLLWMSVAALVVLGVAACGGSGPGEGATVTGEARLDGERFDARWIGARVRNNGLVTPCQQAIPRIEDGVFEIPVFGETQSAGCGRPGSEILLWTHDGEQMLFATESVLWPDEGGIETSVEFSTDDPLGASTPTTDFAGEVRDAAGNRITSGALVEAYVGDTLCAVATVHSGEVIFPELTDLIDTVGEAAFGSDPFRGYIISVVGPGSIPGCLAGAEIEFRVDGHQTGQSKRNSPAESGNLDLATVRSDP